MQLDTTKNKPSMKGVFLPPNRTSYFTFLIKITTSNRKVFTEALLDTGASACFMDKEFAI